VPASTVFAPTDFETQTLAGGLRAAGFRADRPAFFSWLGVTIYLSRDAVAGTLETIAAAAKGSQLVFDFAPPPATLQDDERRRHEAMAANVASSGEPWIGYYDPATFADELRAAGFALAEVLGAADMNERYFRHRADGFQVYGSGRMMTAQV